MKTTFWNGKSIWTKEMRFIIFIIDNLFNSQLKVKVKSPIVMVFECRWFTNNLTHFEIPKLLQFQTLWMNHALFFFFFFLQWPFWWNWIIYLFIPLYTLDRLNLSRFKYFLTAKLWLKIKKESIIYISIYGKLYYIV